MYIKLPADLPARQILKTEGMELAGQADHSFGERRPLRIALLNLMPKKPVTETQLARLLGGTPYPVDLTLVIPDSYRPKTTPAAHISKYYRRWSEICHQGFDGLVVTGAPVETLPFEAVDYWEELTEIFDWAKSHVTSSFYICWAAQAALYHFHAVPKHALREKLFGVFQHRVVEGRSALLRGFGGAFPVPVSRHSETRHDDLPRDRGLAVLAESPESGLCLIEDRDLGATYMFNHLEYDRETLAEEYLRDLRAGREIDPPRNYFPADDPRRPPVEGWQDHGRLLFGNWIQGIHEAISARQEIEQSLQWLFSSQRRPSIVGSEGMSFLVCAADRPDTLVHILRRLADFDRPPRAVKVQRQGAAAVQVALRLAPGDAAMAERVARALLAIGEVRSVAYRNSKGAGGIFVDQGACRSSLDSSIDRAARWYRRGAA
jgi:homoserine O-succinyltransferase